jgi:transcriptional regulator with XRE-family HTH domain
MTTPPPMGARRTGHHGHATPTDAQRRYLAEFGLNVLARRRKLGYTKEFVAAYLGWSGTKIANIEQGRITITLLDLIDLAEALTTHPAALAFPRKRRPTTRKAAP